MAYHDLFLSFQKNPKNAIHFMNNVHCKEKYLICFKKIFFDREEIVIIDSGGKEIDRIWIQRYKNRKFCSKKFHVLTSKFLGLNQYFNGNTNIFSICDQYYYDDPKDKALIFYVKLINKYLIVNNYLYGNKIQEFINSDKFFDFIPNTINENYLNAIKKSFMLELCNKIASFHGYELNFDDEFSFEFNIGMLFLYHKVCKEKREKLCMNNSK